MFGLAREMLVDLTWPDSYFIITCN